MNIPHHVRRRSVCRPCLVGEKQAMLDSHQAELATAMHAGVGSLRSLLCNDHGSMLLLLAKGQSLMQVLLQLSACPHCWHQSNAIIELMLSPLLHAMLSSPQGRKMQLLIAPTGNRQHLPCQIILFRNGCQRLEVDKCRPDLEHTLQCPKQMLEATRGSCSVPTSQRPRQALLLLTEMTHSYPLRMLLPVSSLVNLCLSRSAS